MAPKFFNKTVEIDGRRRRFRDWLIAFTESCNEPGLDRLFQEVLPRGHQEHDSGEALRVYAERVAGLTEGQAKWVKSVFERRVLDAEVAYALQDRLATPSPELFNTARSLRLATSILALQVGPKSCILVKVDPNASSSDVHDLGARLTEAFNCTVVAMPSDVNFEVLSVQDLVRLRDRFSALITHLGGCASDGAEAG